MKRILMSLVTITAMAAVVVAVTGAYFSDEETSTNNTFQAGSLDLLVDNTCYYNGKACINGKWGDTQETCACTWKAGDLDDELFFNFSDLKPGDWEEDTISLKVVDNNAWACANITLTKDEDNTCTEPELDVEPTACVANNQDSWDGEITKNLQFMWWLDDGDNVYETTESLLYGGPHSLADMVGTDHKLDLTFADKTMSMLGQDPYMLGEKTYYLGKAFCFGAMTPAPVVGLDQSNQPIQNSPLINPGFTCNGAVVDNAPQTDIAMGNLSFYVEQVRNNPNFVCPERATPTPTSTLTPQ